MANFSDLKAVINNIKYNVARYILQQKFLNKV